MDTLENKILSLEELRSVKEPSKTSNEGMVCIHGWLSTKPRPGMKQYTNDRIFVRKTVAYRLRLVNRDIEKLGLSLLVVYGYRHPKVQSDRFTEICLSLHQKQPDLREEEICAMAHNFVAAPDVAGHPTGGAVDLTLSTLSGKELDMGCSISDFSNPELLVTFSKLINREQMENRLVLRIAMLKHGFIPFNGEWWHFSFGDKEWAYWKERSPLYSQIDFISLD